MKTSHQRAWRKFLTGLCLAWPLWALSASDQGAAPDVPLFSQAELDQMLAPIALYPDTVLSHILIAATYPLEVVEAARWSAAHPGLDGEAAVQAVEHKDWDPSVQALVAFPHLIQRMGDEISWTHKLGDAFLTQEERVVGTIQGLREQAWAEGHLQQQEHIQVHREPEVIVIEPAVREVVYVPYYDTRVVYGNWWWPAHPPVYWVHPVHYGPRSHVAFYWGSGVHVSYGFYFSSFHWPRRQVVVVHHHHHRQRPPRFYSGRDVARYRYASHWRHNPHHRRGVAYRSAPPNARLLQTEQRAGVRQQAQQRQWAATQRERHRSDSGFSRRSTDGHWRSQEQGGRVTRPHQHSGERQWSGSSSRGQWSGAGDRVRVERGDGDRSATRQRTADTTTRNFSTRQQPRSESHPRRQAAPSSRSGSSGDAQREVQRRQWSQSDRERQTRDHRQREAAQPRQRSETGIRGTPTQGATTPGTTRGAATGTAREQQRGTSSAERTRSAGRTQHWQRGGEQRPAVEAGRASRGIERGGQRGGEHRGQRSRGDRPSR